MNVGYRARNLASSLARLFITVIARIVEDGKWVRKRAKGSIYAKRPNGKCPSATYKPQEKTKP